MRIIAIVCLLIGLSAAPAFAQQKPSVDPARVDAVDQVGVPDRACRLAVAARSGRDDEAVLRPPQPAAARGRGSDPATREGRDRVSGRRQVHGRLEEGRAPCAIRLRAALHRLSGPRSERRQLLCLPPADRAGSQLRHDRAEPAQLRQAPQFRRGRNQGGLREDLQFAGGAGVLATCRGSAPTRF